MILNVVLQSLTLLLKAIACFLILMIIVAIVIQYAHAGDTVFRDSRGRTEGTASTSGNQTTFRDSRGNITGRSVTDSSGQTRFFDARGNSVGTSSRR